MQLGKSYGDFQNTIYEIQPFLVKKITKKYMTFTENYRPRTAAQPFNTISAAGDLILLGRLQRTIVTLFSSIR